MRLQDYRTLYNLAKKRLDSPEAYVAFQRFQGELLVEFFHRRDVPVGGQHVLDLGCGLGGYSLALQDRGAQVVGLDLSPWRALDGLDTMCADAMILPLKSGEFDMIVCASLIEHVPSPVRLIREMHRVLRVGGIAYLSFPPFYTPIGGHQFSPFHLLGERFALRIARLRQLYRGKLWLQERYAASPASFAQAYGDWGLYSLTIGRVEKMLRIFPFQMVERSTRWLSLDFSGVPLLREVLTWHVQFLLQKTGEIPPHRP